MAAGYSRNAAAFTRPSPLLRVELHISGHAPGTVSRPEGYPHPPPATGREGDPHPHPSALPPPPSNPFTPLFFPTPDQFLETSRRRQTPTPHSRTRVAPPTPSDRDPIRDRVRGREYSHPHSPLRAHEGVPPPFCFSLSDENPSSAAFVSCANRGTPPLTCPEVPPPPDQSEVPPEPPPGGRPYSDPLPPLMYEGEGSTPYHHQPQGGGYPPMPLHFALVSPHLRVELTMERRNFRPVSDRGDTPHSR